MSPSSVATAAKAAGRPLKNPLRVAGVVPFPAAAAAPPAAELAPDPPVPALSGHQLRRMEISQFIQWLRTQTNKHKRPFSEHAIEGYAETARVLDRWMTEQDIGADFTTCDTALLNRFFADYLATHSQGGTNTRQRNLHHLFKWLAKTRGHPDPWTTELVRYGPSEVPPSTLAMELIQDLLEVTGNGSAKGFADVRDHAIVRMLTEGVRREELAQQQITDLPENVIERPFVRVVPLKGNRSSTQGRLVPLSMATANALAAYLRIRRSHKQAESSALWLGSRNRGPMTGSGVYQMLHRRALEAGYAPVVRPHQFRHTFANDWLDGGGSEGDLMRLMGWSSRSMVDRVSRQMTVIDSGSPGLRSPSSICVRICRARRRYRSSGTVSGLAGRASQFGVGVIVVGELIEVIVDRGQAPALVPAHAPARAVRIGRVQPGTGVHLGGHRRQRQRRRMGTGKIRARPGRRDRAQQPRAPCVQLGPGLLLQASHREVPGGIRLADGNLAGRGDWIVTRSNRRTLAVNRGRDWVKNGDAWQVIRRHPDGSLACTHLGHGGHVRLPAQYVRDSVELLYATTAHRAEGTTVDTAHPLVTAGMTREMLYVLASRAREKTTLYVATHDVLPADEDERTDRVKNDPRSYAAREILHNILAAEGSELSATGTIRKLQDEAASLATLVPRYLHAAHQLADRRYRDAAVLVFGERAGLELAADPA